MNNTFDYEKYNKRILVTGCAGFIGSHLVKYLVNKYPNYLIIGFDALTYCGNIENIKEAIGCDNFIFERGNICSQDDINHVFYKYFITDVIHLAAESHVDNSIENPLVFVETNVIGTVQLLNMCKFWWRDDYTKHRFYHVSTDEVYGALDFNDKPFTEETKYNPHSPYSASKASSDHFVRAYGDTYGMNVVISNCSNNFGTHQYPEKLIPKTVYNLINGKKIPIYGKGENIRDWLFVGDHVKAIDEIFHSGSAKSTYNIGGNNEISNIVLVNNIIDIYKAITNQEFKNEDVIEFVEDRKGHDLRYAIDSSKLQERLYWEPSQNFDELLFETIKWYIEKFNK